MNFIPYYYESIDRNAILVRPKKPYYDWTQQVFIDIDGATEMEEHNIYLVREMDNNEDVKKWIKKNFDKLFVNELNDWDTDESDWPAPRTYKMFCEWFDIEIHSMILDLEESPVTKE